MNKTKVLYQFLSVAAGIFCCTPCFATNYYFSNEGSDAANGRSINKPWKTIGRLAKIKLRPGDTVLFRRSDVFEGGLRILQSGTVEKPIVITAYGEGADPILTGAVQVNNWKDLGNDRYEATVAKQVYDVFAGDERYTPARFPNNDFLTIDQGFGKDSIAVAALTQPDGYWNGALLRIRPLDWVYETRTVATYQKGLIIQGRQNRYAIEASFTERTQAGKIGLYAFQKGYGFYLEGLPQMIDTVKEWAWQQNKLLLQLPDEKDINSIKANAVVTDYGVWINAGVKNITIKGLHFKQYEKAGVGVAWHVGNINVSVNQFNQIHGVGVLLDSASLNCVISYNNFTDILGRGISALEPVGLEISGNTIKRIGLVRGQGWSGVNGASGIVIHNVERAMQTDTSFAHHNLVKYNRVDSCGYNGIRVDGSYNLVEKNVIDHCSMTLNDGANLYCFGKGPGVTHHSIFRNNIVRYSIGDSKGTPGNPNLAFGIYIDNNSTDMLVEGNTVISTGASGILNNDASFNNTIRNNIIYDCKEGLGFAEWANVGKIFGLAVEGNLVVSLNPAQKAVSITNWLAPALNVGKLTNNHYVNLTTTALFKYTTRQIPEATRLDLSFEQWKNITSVDKESMALTASANCINGFEAFILVNDLTTTKDYLLNDRIYFFLDGRKAPGEIRVGPFKSQILLAKKY